MTSQDSLMNSLIVGETNAALDQNGWMTDRYNRVMEQALSYPSAGVDMSQKLIPHHFVARSPDLLFVTYMKHMSSQLTSEASYKIIEIDNYYLAMLNHMLIQHYLSRIYTTYSGLYDTYVRNQLSTFKVYTIGIPYVFTVVNLVICCVVIWMLVSVKKTIRHSLAFLSLVDFEVIAASTPLTDLVSGVFSARQSATSATKVISEVADHADFVIIEVTPDMVVKLANKAIEEKWHP